MGLSVGIVGLPNVGKSTIFNALTAAGAESANYPFCTIEPNVGIVPVIDRRLAERSRSQVARGLIAETQAALDAGVPASAAVLTGIGYAEALAHLRGEVTLEDLPDVMAASNRRYARRQMRWWRRDVRIRWFEIEPDPVPAILNYVESN